MTARHRAEIKCQICGVAFEVQWALRGKRKTCGSAACRTEWDETYRRISMLGNKFAVGHLPNATSFKKGIVPWNKGTKSVMKPNSGSFQVGRESDAKEAIGTVVLRNDKNGGQRAWVKIAEAGDPSDWKLRAQVVWEAAYGPVESGLVLHHRDFDKLNDVLSNLEAITRAEHINRHREGDANFREKSRHASSVATKKRHAANRAARERHTKPFQAILR